MKILNKDLIKKYNQSNFNRYTFFEQNLKVPLVVILSCWSCGLGNLGLRLFSGDLFGLPPGFLGLPAFLGLPRSFSNIDPGVLAPVLVIDVFAVLD